MNNRGRGRGESRGRGEERSGYSREKDENRSSRESGGGRGGGGGRGRGGEGRGRGKVPLDNLPDDRKITLITNMFPAEVDKNSLKKLVCRYEMVILNTKRESPPVGRKRRRYLIYYLFAENFKNIPLATDGASILYTLSPLNEIEKLKPPKEFYIQSQKQSADESEVDLSSEESKFEPTALHYYLQFPILGKAKPMIAIVQLKKVDWDLDNVSQMLQIVVQSGMFFANPTNTLVKGARIFDTRKFSPLGIDLNVYSGVFQSFRETEKGLLLNVDVSYFAGTKEIIVYDWLQKKAQAMGFRNFPEAFSNDKFKAKVHSELKGIEIEFTYRKGSAVLGGLDFSVNSMTANFKTKKDGKEIDTTVLSYMKGKYNLEIKDRNIPLLIEKERSSNKKGKCYIHPELCKISSGQKRKTSLNSDERTKMIELTRSEPVERFASIQGYANTIEKLPSLSQFTVKLHPESQVQISARVLPPIPIELYKDQIKPDIAGSWNMFKRNFAVAFKGQASWGFVYCKELQNSIDEFVNSFISTAKNVGISLKAPVEFKSNNSIESYIQCMKECAKKQPLFIVILIPDKDSMRHGALKNLGDQIIKIPTKCLVLDSSRKSTPPVLSNVLSSINAKLGGENWFAPPVIIKSWLGIDVTQLLVIGADVCHGEALETGGSSSNSGRSESSIAAFCASQNDNFTKYHTALNYQRSRLEIIPHEGLVKMMTSCLDSYQRNNKGQLPPYIIFYRDGIGEGMYERCKREEIAAIQEASTNVYKKALKSPPKMTFIIVQKRNHFRSVINQRGEYFNPYVGTLINSDVTDKRNQNFYLYSHGAIQGTAKPTHYQILLNEPNFSQSGLESFTFALTHLHQGCSRSISIPAPVFFADKACGRAKDYYKENDTVDERIQNAFMI
jgi:eukaryotic translation initiation factor 2C